MKQCRRANGASSLLSRAVRSFALRSRTLRSLAVHSRVALASFCFGLLLASGCGYSFTGSALPAHVKSVAVPTFENQTVEAELPQQVTSALTDRLVKDGRIKLAAESQAQARFEAQVSGYENKVYNYTADQTPKDYIVVITLSITLRDMVKNRELWKDEAMKGTSIYSPNGGSATLSNEPDARKEAIANLARDIVNRTLESW